MKYITLLITTLIVACGPNTLRIEPLNETPNDRNEEVVPTLSVRTPL